MFRLWLSYLRPIRVRARVCHGEEAGRLVLQQEVLVLKLLSVNGLAPRPVAVGEVAALQHERLDDAMENGALVGEPGLANAEAPEVVGGLGDDAAEELHDDAADGLAGDGDVEEHDGVGLVAASRIAEATADGRGDGQDGIVVERDGVALPFGCSWHDELGSVTERGFTDTVIS